MVSRLLYIRRIVMTDLKKYFTIGERIQIDHIDIRGNLQEYTSQVVDIREADFMDVLIPIHKNQDVYLKVESIVKIVLPKGDAVYEFKAVVYEKLFGRVPLLRLKIISEVNKIQRRNFYRLKLMRDIEARRLISEAGQESGQGKKLGDMFKCYLNDISAGGVLISTKEDIQEGDTLELRIDLNGIELVAFGIIVRRTLTVSPRAPYSYGVKFDKMSEFDKNKLSKFIFEEQRKLIKKGLI